MKKIAIIMTVILLASVSFASALTIKSVTTPKKKIQFNTENHQYVSSFTPYKTSTEKTINIKKAVDILEKHFTQERGIKVSGRIWDNTPEGPEIIFHAYNKDNDLVADIRVSLEYFSNKEEFPSRVKKGVKLRGDFIEINDALESLSSKEIFLYNLSGLKESVETAIGADIIIHQIRQKGDNSRQKITHTDSGFIILEL